MLPDRCQRRLQKQWQQLLIHFLLKALRWIGWTPVPMTLEVKVLLGQSIDLHVSTAFQQLPPRKRNKNKTSK